MRERHCPLCYRSDFDEIARVRRRIQCLVDDKSEIVNETPETLGFTSISAPPIAAPPPPPPPTDSNVDDIAGKSHVGDGGDAEGKDGDAKAAEKLKAN